MPYGHYYEKSKMFHGSLLKIMGTGLDVLMMGDDRHLLACVWDDILAEVQRLHGMLNRFDTESEISLINREAAARPVILHDELWRIITEAREYHRRTYGYFDISLQNYDLIHLDENQHSIQFLAQNLSLDFGGYAKGYALSQIKTILSAAGIGQALVNFGNSSVLAIGTHPYGDSWNIGVENPFSPGQQLKVFGLVDQSLSTSGNTSGHTCHIINPHSGIYTPARKIVSVVAEDCILAEVLSTALMVADNESSEMITESFKNAVVYTFNCDL